MKFLSWFCEVNEFQNWSHWKLFERLNRPMHTPQEVFATSTSQFGSSKNAPFWMSFDFTIVTKEIRIKNLIFLEWWGSRPPFWGRRRRQIFFTWTDYSCYVTYLYILIISKYAMVILNHHKITKTTIKVKSCWQSYIPNDCHFGKQQSSFTDLKICSILTAAFMDNEVAFCILMSVRRS